MQDNNSKTHGCCKSSESKNECLNCKCSNTDGKEEVVIANNPNSVASNQDVNSIFHPKATNQKLNEMLASFGIPDWIIFSKDGKPRKCFNCNKELTLLTIRGISICLNAQHYGDIQVEILCNGCFSSYFLHFRRAGPSMTTFVNSLLGECPMAEPVLRHEIKPEENNLAIEIVTDAACKHVSCITKTKNDED